jgi:hypothetical protein
MEMPSKKRGKDKTRPEPLKAKTLGSRTAEQVKGGRAGGGGTQSEDEVYVGLR